MTKEMLEPFAKAWKTPILYIEADEGFKLFNPVYPDSITLLDEAPTVQIAKMKVRISLNGLFKELFDFTVSYFETMNPNSGPYS